MGLKQKIKNLPAFYTAILAVLNFCDYFNWRFHRQFQKYRLTPYWQERITTVRSSPDNERLDHVAGAGRIFDDHQLMGNGLKITLGCYYDYGNTHLLVENRGVHEPQEEYAFAQVLASIPAKGTMMELGSYWAFYSMWFAREVNGARCLMIEPDPHKMNFGRLNFKLNGLHGIFDLGFITDQTDSTRSIPSYTVDQLMRKYEIGHLNLLHSDIQGFELRMLDGCTLALQQQRIDYFFISTHSNEIHQACLGKLVFHDYCIVCDANLDESFSVDGLIVARRKAAAGPDRIEISRKR